MFDFTPLTNQHLVLGVIAFAASYFSIALVNRRGWLRRNKAQPHIFYAGAILVATTIVIIAWILREQTSLVLSLVAAGFVILVGGIWDEEHRLSPGHQLILQALAAAIVVFGGWTIQHISEPVGSGVILFNPVIGGVLALGWLLLLMNAVNWLDGIDGLAPSVSLIALLTLSAISLLPSVQDSTTLAISIIGAATVGGFLLWNFPPARIYLGTSGSWFLGLFIGIVAIRGGGKIATTLLVLALPVVDVLMVSAARLVVGRKPWQGDTTRHLHHRLLAHGFSHRTITLIAMVLTVVLGVGAIVLQTQEKIIALAVSAGLLLISGTALALNKGQSKLIGPKSIGVVVICVLVAVALIGWQAKKPCRDFAQGSVAIGTTTWSVAIADTTPEYSRGLMECASLPSGSGMYFEFPQPATSPFWMKDMQIPLDIVWILENKIIGIEANVPPAGGDPNPPRYYAPQPYTAVLELPAGEAAQYGLAVGQEAIVDK